MNAFQSETRSHKHIQRMTPSERDVIDAEIKRLSERGVKTDRTTLVRTALAAYFDTPAAARTRLAKAG